jgi:hypothetical protein
MGRSRSAVHGTARQRRETPQRQAFTLYGKLAPRSWLLGGTALKIGLFAGLSGVVALPTQAFATCAGTDVIACGDGGDGYSNTGVINTDKWITVVPGGVVTTGINLSNTGNSGNFDAEVRGATDEQPTPASVSGGTIDGINLVTTTGTVHIGTEAGTTVTGGSGNHDGIRARSSTGNITLDLNGDSTAGGSGEAVDAQSSAGGTVEINLDDGTYTGLTSQTIVGNSTGGEVDVNVAKSVTLSGGNDAKDHGVWVINSSVANIDFDGTIDTVTGDGIHVGRDTNIAAGTAGEVNIDLGTDSDIVATVHGVYVNTNGAAGDVELNNDGHIQGNTGTGATVLTAGNITSYNHSYLSWLGDTDGYEASGLSFDFDNGNGLMVGVHGDGLNVHDITGTDKSVEIDNHGWWTDEDDNGGGGVIFGGTNGINIATTAGDAWIINAGSVAVDGPSTSGGLVVGLENGLDASDIGGSFLISNDLTGDSSVSNIDFGDLDPLVDPLTADASAYAGDRTTGIWGGDDGVHTWDVDGLVGVSNMAGVIVGVDGDGIFAGNVDGTTTAILDGYPGLTGVNVAFALDNASVGVDSPAGIVWGGDTGVHLYDMNGTVALLNGNGTIFGGDTGVHIYDVEGGDVVVDNDLGGVVQGLYGDGIHIGDVQAIDEIGGTVGIENAGSIYGGDHAIYVANSDAVNIENSGAVIGDGGSSQSMIRLDGNGTAQVTNDVDGVIGSRALPGVTTSWSLPDPAELPGWSADDDTLTADVAALGRFVTGGGALDTDELSLYGDASNDRAISSRNGGSTSVTNNGLLVGTVDLRGDDGSTVTNNGTWLVSGRNQVRGTYDGDTITNNGLIQTAFNAAGTDWTSFRADSIANTGALSMVDGGTGDRTYLHGDFAGGGALAIDVDLALGESDQLRLRDGSVTGETGVVVRLVSGGGNYGSRIEFANYDDSGTGADAFYLDATSDKYVQVAGKGVIQDGLLGWYVDQDSHNGFDLVAGWGPGAYDAPGVVTGAQGSFYSGLGVVEDHMSGGQYVPSGGGGADLDGARTKSAIWVKSSGDFVERNTSVSVSPLGAVATGSSQGIYSVLGGADLIPGGSNFRAGMFGGYVGSQLDFALPGTSVDYSGATVGAYGAYNDGAFNADLTVKGDLLGATYKFAGTSVAATVVNLGASGDLGYRFGSSAGYIEPVVSAAALATRVTDVSAIDFHDANSLRAGIGTKIGTEVVSGDITTEFSLLGKVWNEFGGANTATVSNGGSALTATDDIGGVFGELAATATMQSAENDMSGFLTAGSKFGANSTSYGLKGGLRVGF